MKAETKSMRFTEGFLVLALVCLAVFLLWPAGPMPAAQAQEGTEPAPVVVPDDHPIAPEGDLTVKVYKALDNAQKTHLTFKDRQKVGQHEVDVDVVVDYFNWCLSDDDFWNRQLSIEIRNKDGFVIEKIVKSGFGELGFILAGETKTRDAYRLEQVRSSGDSLIATLEDLEIKAAEKARYRELVEKFLLKK
ncbi:MAG: hypothetical protein AB1898_03255 [Acidobacteriota bacterium]